MSHPKIGILMGSKSDLPVMEQAAKVLADFGIGYEMKVLSAHRTPKETAQYAEEAEGRGLKAIICGAGGSAALAGVVAAHTALPVIGIPIESVLNGLDSLLSTVQMPPGVPVAAVAIGKPGARNAALLAVRILALSDAQIASQLKTFMDDQRRKILAESDLA